MTRAAVSSSIGCQGPAARVSRFGSLVTSTSVDGAYDPDPASPNTRRALDRRAHAWRMYRRREGHAAAGGAGNLRAWCLRNRRKRERGRRRHPRRRRQPSAAAADESRWRPDLQPFRTAHQPAMAALGAGHPRSRPGARRCAGLRATGRGHDRLHQQRARAQRDQRALAVVSARLGASRGSRHGLEREALRVLLGHRRGRLHPQARPARVPQTAHGRRRTELRHALHAGLGRQPTRAQRSRRAPRS